MSRTHVQTRMYTHTHTYIHTHMRAHFQTHTHTYTHTNTRARAHFQPHVQTKHTHTYTHTRTQYMAIMRIDQIFTLLSVYIYMHVCACICMHIYIYIRVYTYIGRDCTNFPAARSQYIRVCVCVGVWKESYQSVKRALSKCSISMFRVSKEPYKHVQSAKRAL